MVNILDIIYSITNEITAIMPNANFDIGKISEDQDPHTFLFLVTSNNNQQHSAFTKESIVNIQAVYFPKPKGYENNNLEENLRTLYLLGEFLNRFNIKVKDRNLKFKYDTTDSDGQMIINFNFRFLDGCINTSYTESQKAELMQKIYINKEEL